MLASSSKLVEEEDEKKERGVAILGEFSKMKMDRKSLNTLRRRLNKEANHEIVVTVDDYYSNRQFSRLKSYGINATILLSLITMYRLWKN